ncbi:MAG: hypothetical protein SWQ30_19430 [Thermodesulfobacteriota bacterium]|nr:hypothetical protein [Thermodesulfobacteriota bacterium]
MDPLLALKGERLSSVTTPAPWSISDLKRAQTDSCSATAQARSHICIDIDGTLRFQITLATSPLDGDPRPARSPGRQARRGTGGDSVEYMPCRGV